MRIALSVPSYPPGSLVGAWVSTHVLMADLVGRGHTVDVVTTARRSATYVHDGVTVHPWSRALLSDTVEAADLVVSHLGDAGHGAMWAARHRKPLVRMVHSSPYRNVGPQSFDEHHPTDLAVYNAHATAAEYGWSGPSIVVHPPIDRDRYRVSPGGRVTLVNLNEAKGGPLFWSLADRLPSVEFLAVPGHYGRQVMPAGAEAALEFGVDDAAPNVHIMQPQEDVRRVYERTRVLLVPSLRESYGRVAVEAMCSGIPVIAHPTPGLQEACGDAAIWCDRDDEDAWVDAIEALTDPTTWNAWSTKALAHTSTLDPAADLNRFADAVESLVKVPA